jgi:hypothetical protein
MRVLAEEAPPKARGGLTVGFRSCSRVNPKCEPRIGVTEPGLGGLDVDAFEDETGGVGPPEVVVLEPIEFGLPPGRIPDSVKPVGVVEVFAVGSDEEEGRRVVPSDASMPHVGLEEPH